MSGTFKIISAGVLATSAMTICSYSASWMTGRNYREPELLSRAFAGMVGPTLPETAGWLLHYGFGVSWAAVEIWLLDEIPIRDGSSKILALGIFSGLTGILLWKLIFKIRRCPPHPSVRGFFLHLLLVHLVYTYTLADAKKRLSD
jgi:hypothetical protein